MPNHNNHFINQLWIAGTGSLLISRNPANEEILWQGYGAGAKEVTAAVQAAKEAYPLWSETPIEKRISYLHCYGEHVMQQIDSLAEAISKETGKPLWESKNELRAAVNKIDVSIAAYRERCPEVNIEHQLGRSIRRHKPHGVIAVFGPFNFPFHLPNGHIIPALLAGNTIVLKPSELTPMVAEEMMLIWEKCGLPPGVLNMVQGGRDTGRLLSSSVDLNGLFFTGSWPTGLLLSELWAKHPEKILALEMGGNNPLVFTEVKDLEAAAYQTIQSAYITSGQRCSCARRLIVTESPKAEEFIKILIEMIRSIKVGPYTDRPEPFMGPMISESSARHLLTVQETLRGKRGKSLVDMRLLKIDSALLSPGLIDVTDILHRMDEEIFGPLLQLIRVPNFEAAIAEANHTHYGLTAGLLSDNETEYQQFYQRARAGIINWNVPLTGASSSAPFGGIGWSGNNRPSGFYAADYCAYPVASIEAPTPVLPSNLTPGIGYHDTKK